MRKRYVPHKAKNVVLWAVRGTKKTHAQQSNQLETAAGTGIEPMVTHLQAGD